VSWPAVAGVSFGLAALSWRPCGAKKLKGPLSNADRDPLDALEVEVDDDPLDDDDETPKDTLDEDDELADEDELGDPLSTFFTSSKIFSEDPKKSAPRSSRVAMAPRYMNRW